MKRRFWFLGSVFAMLLILAMWWLTLHGHTSHIVVHSDYKNGTSETFKTTVCRSFYGFGADEIEDDFWDVHPYSKEYELTKIFLPSTKFGWVLFVLAGIQWFFLSRKFRTKTKQFAIGVDPSDLDKQIKNTYRPGGFVFDLKFFRLFTYIQVTLAIVILISNTLCVVISKSLKYVIYSEGYAFESMQLNIEYILPGVLYLTATLISVYCLQKYIKSCQSP